MKKDERDLLEVLKFELQFLEAGGYGCSPRTPWRPVYVFEDSLTCMNYDSKENPAPCNDCVLMQLVPPERRSEQIACRHIPFNTSGATLDSLYCDSDQREIEETVGTWLRTTIQRLEKERLTEQRNQNKRPISSGERTKGALYIMRASARSAQTPHARLLFIGQEAASFSDFGRNRSRQPRTTQRMMRRPESTA